MRLYSLLSFVIIAVVFNCDVLGQGHNTPPDYFEPTPKEALLQELANECFNTNKYDRLQRLKIYPFNRAKTIQVISFKDERRIPVNKQEIDYSKVSESHVLDPNQIDELTNILYNIGYNPDIKTPWGLEANYKCYEPRNGILFLNPDGKIMEFIEICFTCHRTTASSKRVKEGTYCTQKFSLLERFFKNLGIKHVTSMEDPILAYDQIIKLDTADMLIELKRKLQNKLQITASSGLINAESIRLLNDTEQKVLILLNSRNIHGSGITGSGLADFYYDYSGQFYQETVELLAEIGAIKTLAAYKASLLQWPDEKIPPNIADRRRILLMIINKAMPNWKALESELYTHKLMVGGEELIAKENLNDLIFKYIILHKEGLILRTDND